MTKGPAASDKSYGNNGAFALRLMPSNALAICIASDGGEWDHVSIRVNDAPTPSWEIMCLIKEIFWDAEDCVVQFHPPASEYVNRHPNVLHLWRPQKYAILTPPKEMV